MDSFRLGEVLPFLLGSLKLDVNAAYLLLVSYPSRYY